MPSCLGSLEALVLAQELRWKVWRRRLSSPVCACVCIVCVRVLYTSQVEWPCTYKRRKIRGTTQNNNTTRLNTHKLDTYTH